MFLSEFAGIVNSRPLSEESLADVNAPVPISPNSLLTIKYSVVMSLPVSSDSDSGYSRKRWKRVQYLANEFCTRWKSEFLQGLQSRSKWKRGEQRSFRIGDIILLKDELSARCSWSLCKVVEIYPSVDGKVRSVKLLVGSKKLDNKGKQVGERVIPGYINSSVYFCWNLKASNLYWVI